jgi:D-amino-acid oxidase
VTIVARNMPGDPPSLGWASPWAGAMWFGVDGSTPAQEKMQRESFQRLWQLAEEAPESSVRVSQSSKAGK